MVVKIRWQRSNPELYFTDFVSAANEVGKKYGFPKFSLAKNHLRRAIQNVFEFKGRVYPNCISAAFEIINHFIEGRHGVALSAFIQSGKTEVQAVVTILGPVIISQMKGGQRVIPFAMTPGTDSLFNQFASRIQDIYHALTPIKVGEVTIQEYHEDLMYDLNPMIEKYKVTSVTRPIMVAPIRKNYVPLILDLTKTCTANGDRLLLLQDECDIYSGEGTVLDRKLDEGVYQTYRNQTSVANFQVLRTSATNFDWHERLGGIPTVKIRPGEGLVGFNVDPADPTRKLFDDLHVTLPIIESWSEIANRLNLPMLKSNKLKKILDRAMDTGEGSDAVDEIVQSIKKVAVHLLETIGSNGMMLRFVNDNKVMLHIAQELQHLIGHNVCIITHFTNGDEKAGSLMSNAARRRAEFCAQRPGRTLENTKYIIIVTADCRQGVNIPNDCNIIASLGSSPNTPIAALLQDVGRPLGYKPGAYILTCDVNAAKLRSYANLTYETDFPGELHRNVIVAPARKSIKFCRTGHEAVNAVYDPKVDALCGVMERFLKRQDWFTKNRKSCRALFMRYIPVLEKLAEDEGCVLKRYSGEIKISKRTKNRDGSDREGGKNGEDVLVRVEQGTGKVLAIEWLVDGSSSKKKKSVRGGMSEKLNRKAA
jgi:hypothetical protein